MAGELERTPAGDDPGRGVGADARGAGAPALVEGGGVRVLGIDPGTRVIGYGVIDVLGPGQVRYVECGIVRAATGDDVGARIHELCGHVAEILEELRPAEVAIEGAFHGLNAASALKLAESRGAYRELCFQRGLRPAEYAPARVKRVVRGEGAATKAELAARVAALLGLERAPSPDAADALAIALCHASHLCGPAISGRWRR